MKYLILSAFFILSFAAGCKKNDPNASQALAGNWRLLGSGGGFTGKDRYVPPATEIHTLQINTDNTYSTFTNTTVQHQGSYRLQQVQSIYTNSNANAIAFDGSPAQLYTFSKDTLVLADNHVEPYSSTYARIR